MLDMRIQTISQKYSEGSQDRARRSIEIQFSGKRCVDDGRVAISAVAVGMAQGVLERAAKYSKERVTFGKPICENQAIAYSCKRPFLIPLFIF
mgnify:CR=1 FL=1